MRTQKLTYSPEIDLPSYNKTVLRTVWKFKVVDESLVPREYMQPNEKLIGGTIRSSKGKMKIPGIEAYEE